MFKCKDCNLEYGEKPDYCDCGNNLFDELESQKSYYEENNKQPQDIKKNFVENHPRLKSTLASLDILSSAIFIVCIILSILSWIFIGKEAPKSEHAKKPTIKAQKQVKNSNIPNVNSFWNDTAAKAKSPIPEETPPPQTQQKPQVQAQQTKTTESPVLNATKKPVPQKTAEPKINKPIVKQNNTVKQKAAPSNSMSKYKAALRQSLFSRLSVNSIQGSGKCTVEFALSPNGKLLNRKFAQLSDNKSLNDAVYNMLMSVPQYYPPPADYNGGKIRLSFSFDNGYYEVSF